MLLDIRVPVRPAYDKEMLAAERFRQLQRKKESLPPLRYRRRIEGRIWAASDIADIMSLAEKGYTRTQISQAYRVTKGTICGLVAKEKDRRAKAAEIPIAATAEAVQPSNAHA